MQLLKVADQIYVNANFATQRIALRLANVLYPSLLTEVWLVVTAAMFMIFGRDYYNVTGTFIGMS